MASLSHRSPSVHTDPAPAERPDVPALDVDGASLDWWAEFAARSEWWRDLARDDVADSYGDSGDGVAYDPYDRWERERWEDAEVARQLRPRARSIRVDAEEEARLYGYGR